MVREDKHKTFLLISDAAAFVHYNLLYMESLTFYFRWYNILCGLYDQCYRCKYANS